MYGPAQTEDVAGPAQPKSLLEADVGDQFAFAGRHLNYFTITLCRAWFSRLSSANIRFSLPCPASC